MKPVISSTYLNPYLLNSSCTSAPFSCSQKNSTERVNINTNINKVENSPPEIIKESKDINNEKSPSSFLTKLNFFKSPTVHNKTIISLSHAIPLPENAVMKKNISSTTAVFLYHIPKKGDVVVKKFGDDEIIYPEDRLYQEISAAQEVFASELAKVLKVNVPHSWLIAEPENGNTSVASSFIKQKDNKKGKLIKLICLSNKKSEKKTSFKQIYGETKLPIFHYLINHPDIISDHGAYNNIIVKGNGELYSIDHEGTLGRGRKTPTFTHKQLNTFFPNEKSFEKFKKIDLNKSIHESFDYIFEKYNESIEETGILNIQDLEFRKNHIIEQYDARRKKIK
ncbi:hypothetical protein [Pectobacterium brasiliense]|uniref:hypothetical protein n=1 Tax=Pectobacterium brasiliense TaxID=180957 RepID=UPI0019694DCB|nr:hypothetical protein [Pectobacterium brasiliense]MBN3265491.1 hypothetical protein [Pectobacterium brasiliense]